MASPTLDAKTVTADQLAALPVEELRKYMPALVNVFTQSQADGNPDYSRLELRTRFYDKAYGLDSRIQSKSHSESLQELKDLDPQPLLRPVTAVAPEPVPAAPAPVQTPAPAPDLKP